jgi:UDP-N-acetylglucosamine--N-acetylmuramyl-(pentapeptide) pyrophosphoryl-undecaprenol N-acetylglucosamine transferase
MFLESLLMRCWSKIVESQREGLRILVTGGGTGGHLFPALAVAEQFVSQLTGVKILFVGAGRYIDSKVLSVGEFQTKTIRCGALKGGSFTSRLKTLLSLPVGLLQSLFIINKFKPDLVFGVGGYVTGPVLAAAKLLRVKTCIHEQNSVPGMANRKIGKFVDRVFLSIPGSEKFFPFEKCYLSGNPVRCEFLAKMVGVGCVKDNIISKKFTLMVIGGSQGAHQLNCLIPEALAYFKDELPSEFSVIHQTGAIDVEMVREAYDVAKIKANTSAFFDNMADLVEQADLVVCRAGATTLAELTVLRKPSILVPYPFAADNHQAKNGEFLVQGGAALMFDQKNLDKKLLGEAIIKLIRDNKLREQIGENAGKLAKPDAARKIVKKCLELIEK